MDILCENIHTVTTLKSGFAINTLNSVEGFTCFHKMNMHFFICNKAQSVSTVAILKKDNWFCLCRFKVYY